jgi:hypothetical protein
MKSIAMDTVGLKSLSFLDKEVAQVIDTVLKFKKGLSKFNDCSKDVCSLAFQRVSDIFDKVPKKRSDSKSDVIRYYTILIA